MKITLTNQKNGSSCFKEAFSLLEVMIAIAIFFTSVFAILELTSQHLRTARILQTLDVDRTSLPSLLSMTNFLEIGPLPIDVKIAYEDAHPGVTVDGFIDEVATNGLFRVDYNIHWMSESRMLLRDWRMLFSDIQIGRAHV